MDDRKIFVNRIAERDKQALAEFFGLFNRPDDFRAGILSEGNMLGEIISAGLAGTGGLEDNLPDFDFAPSVMEKIADLQDSELQMDIMMLPGVLPMLAQNGALIPVFEFLQTLTLDDFSLILMANKDLCGVMLDHARHFHFNSENHQSNQLVDQIAEFFQKSGVAWDKAQGLSEGTVAVIRRDKSNPNWAGERRVEQAGRQGLSDPIQGPR